MPGNIKSAPLRIYFDTWYNILKEGIISGATHKAKTIKLKMVKNNLISNISNDHKLEGNSNGSRSNSKK